MEKVVPTNQQIIAEAEAVIKPLDVRMVRGKVLVYRIPIMPVKKRDSGIIMVSGKDNIGQKFEEYFDEQKNQGIVVAINDETSKEMDIKVGERVLIRNNMNESDSIIYQGNMYFNIYATDVICIVPPIKIDTNGKAEK